MKLNGLLLVLLMATATVTFTSCKKKCVIEQENKDSGDIISEVDGYKVALYPSNGYMTGNMDGDYHIHAGHSYASSEFFEVSFDDGYTREAINFNMYNILAFPVTVSCEAALDRNVYIDPGTQTVTYTIKVTECASCNERYTTENYVLVPAFPETYTVVYNVDVTEVE